MAAVAASGTPSLSTPTPGPEHRITGLIAGAALTSGMPSYIKASDGLVYPSDGVAVAAAAKVDGYPATAVAIGEAVSLFHGVNFRYGAGLTPGARLYLASGGGLADAASTGGTTPIGFVIDATRVFLKQSGY